MKSASEPIWRRREAALGAAVILLVLMVGLIRRDFLQPANLRDIVVNASIPAVAAAGMTALIIAAQIDISVGAILGVSAVVVATLAVNGAPLPILLLAGIGAGALLGAVNGALTAGLRIPSIVATLATMGAIRGILLLATRGNTIAVPKPLTDIGYAQFLGFPTITWIAALACVAMGLYLGRTRAGRQRYAVGSNARSAELSGIPVQPVIFRTFVLLGALVGLAGFLYVLRFSPIEPRPQPGFELAVITAVVVGGTDIFGGRGTVLGTVIAALLLSVISAGLPMLATQFKEWRSEVQPAIQGVLILAAVLYNSLSRREE